jgi:hypothetical protein
MLQNNALCNIKPHSLLLNKTSQFRLTKTFESNLSTLTPVAFINGILFFLHSITSLSCIGLLTRQNNVIDSPSVHTIFNNGSIKFKSSSFNFICFRLFTTTVVLYSCDGLNLIL